MPKQRYYDVTEEQLKELAELRSSGLTTKQAIQAMGLDVTPKAVNLRMRRRAMGKGVPSTIPERILDMAQSLRLDGVSQRQIVKRLGLTFTHHSLGNALRKKYGLMPREIVNEAHQKIRPGKGFKEAQAEKEALVEHMDAVRELKIAKALAECPPKLREQIQQHRRRAWEEILRAEAA